MAVGFDRSKIQSMVIFNEISSIYPIGGDIECRFYIDADFVCTDDKIGLYKVGWNDKKDFLVLKDINICETDEFGEKKLIFSGKELPKEISDQQYQFCYFHLLDNIFQLCGTSTPFKFYTYNNENLQPIGDNHNPTAPDFGDKALNQTIPKRRYDTIPNELNEILNNGFKNESQNNSKSIDYELAAKERELAELKNRFAKQNRINELQIQSLNASIKLAEEKYASIQNELKLKLESDKGIEQLQNDLMDTIKLTEAKNSSLEEQLLMRDEDTIAMRKKCSEQEEIIDELKAQLVIIQSELDLYRTKSKETVGQDTENRFLKDKVEELKSKLEKVKNSKENLMTEKNELEKNKMKIEVELELMKENMQEMKQKLDKAEDSKIKITTELKAKEMLMKKHIDDMKSSYKSANDVIIQARNTNSNITVYVNEMKQEMKDYAISHSLKALKSFNDIKSIAESIVNAFNERFGKSWHCFMGESIAHNAFYHDMGSYLSFSIEDLKIILYRTSEMLEFCDVLKSAITTKNVEIKFKNEYVDSAFETLVASLSLESIDEEFGNYAELSGYLAKILSEQYGEKYGNSWLVVAGASDHFDSNYRLTNRRYIELQIGCLKLIILQIDEKTKTQPRVAKLKSLKV